MAYINIDMRTTKLPPLTFGFAPISPREKRKSLEYGENIVAGVADPLFQKEREAHELAAKTKSGKKNPLRIQLKKASDLAFVDPVKRVELASEAIQDHMEHRIQAMLLQFIDCYNTKYHFTVGRVEHQNEGTSRINFRESKAVKIPKGSSRTAHLDAAHHGTLPCIYAYPREAWEAWKAHGDPKAPKKPEARVYGHSSDTYWAGNACSGLERVINQSADVHLDGNPTEKTMEFGKRVKDNDLLRAFSIKLLNRVAQKELDPLEAFNLYLIKLQDLVSSLHTSIESPAEKKVFEIWKQQLESLFEEFSSNRNDFIAQLLHIRYQASEFNLDEVLFPRHITWIQRKNLYQTHLASLVEKVKNEILSTQTKKPPTFDSASKYAIMLEAMDQSPKVRTIFQRYFNLNGATLEQIRDKAYKPALSLATSDESTAKIKKMFSRFSSYIRNFEIEESRTQSLLLRDIRVLKGYSLRTFIKRHNDLFPAHRHSYEQLRRVELGHVKMTEDAAKRYAHALGVPAGFLTPHLAQTG